MNRDELMPLAQAYYDSIKDAADVEPAIIMTGFALGMYEAGQRAERERIIEKMSNIFATRIGSESIAFELNRLLNELSQTAPADSGE